MDDTDLSGILEVLAPRAQSLPVVLASPHSGRHYSGRFLALSQLDPLTLRQSEDGFVDDIFSSAPELGAPLLKALFPRAFVDTNREAFELDPTMFTDRLPPYVNTRSPRAIAGLGTIARIVAHGREIYAEKLCFSEALNRIDRLYRPYHRTLRQMVDHTLSQFGCCILIDCHSMPSMPRFPASRAPSLIPGPMPDFVLGDAYGCTCSPIVVEVVEQWLSARSYRVARNAPYAGGFTTRSYGRPRLGIHALQIEINRALYMDEVQMTRKPYLSTLADQMATLVDAVGRIDAACLAAR